MATKKIDSQLLEKRVVVGKDALQKFIAQSCCQRRMGRADLFFRRHGCWHSRDRRNGGVCFFRGRPFVLVELAEFWLAHQEGNVDPLGRGRQECLALFRCEETASRWRGDEASLGHVELCPMDTVVEETLTPLGISSSRSYSVKARSFAIRSARSAKRVWLSAAMP